LLTLYALLLSSHCAAAQVRLDVKIEPEFLKQDFRKLRADLEASQPGLYLYTPKDSMDMIFDRIEASFTEALTPLGFYRRMAPLNKRLANLHTIFWPSEQYEKGTETGRSRLPLDVHWAEGKLYVLRNNSTKEVPQGSVIHSINGENADAVFQKLVDGTLRDGFNETYPVARASRYFGYYYDELIGAPEGFTLELTTPEGVEEKIDMPGLTASEIKANRYARYKRKFSQYGEDWETWIVDKEPALRFEVKGSVAILTLRTLSYWTIQGNGQKWEDFLNDAFAQLSSKNVSDLIIDVRNNHGGHDTSVC
jgi:hypothetical protein